jgi:Ni,Fe-hydrogenase I small subunit
MGFFKAQRELVQQAKEIQKTQPPMKDRMAQMNARMTAGMEAMAAQTEAANLALTIGANGTPASITVMSATQTGMLNFDLMLTIEAMVALDGQPPYPVTIPMTVNQMQAAYVQPGKTFSGKVDPANRNSVWVDPTSIH